MLLIPIEKLKNGRDSFRKAREAHLIHKAKTIEPLGINKRDELLELYIAYLEFFSISFLSCLFKVTTLYHVILCNFQSLFL